MKLGLAIEQVAEAEAKLAEELRAVGERHKADHDVFFITGMLAGIEKGHVQALTRHADRYDAAVEVSDEPSSRGHGALDRVVEKGAELVGRRPEPALLLLDDLRSLYLIASEASIDWVMLAQGAQAVKDSELVATVDRCHGETLRTVKWATYRIKTASPQALSTG